ncbi:MAG TPA: ABC-F family ATP-binding cassette domain-containing protein, partial [Candidatus Syntrophosphaera thermopropionivorans]|nr:ABC-F family ATP-binding cassette domain-containing protein [Candidatus Syntrophosphaera thermopropionivorans]
MPSEVILTVENLSLQLGSKVIFAELNLGVHNGDKIGIVGINGSGKSTLLRLLAGNLEPTTGTIVKRRDLTLGWLPQNEPLPAEETILQYVLNQNLSRTSVPEEHRYKAMLSLLNLSDWNKPLSLLSGGERRKAGLAKVLAREPDLILLDEPTNHLDLDTIEWLQDYLTKSRKTLLFVSHDRYFLDAVSNRILEIEHSHCYITEGNYTDYVEQKLIRLTDQKRKEIRRQAQLKKELDWLKRGAKARTSKPKDHINRVQKLISQSYLISKPELKISFLMERQGKTILELHNISKSFEGKLLFQNLEHIFQAGEKIGIIGPNGCGKTTLLKIIAGEIKPDTGTVKVGVNTRFSFFSQEEENYNPDLSVFEYLTQYSEVIQTQSGLKLTAKEMLKRFLFDDKMQQQKLASLSGGELRRLFLLKSLMFGANFIILDEPTNDLDIQTLEILEDYLDDFKGCLLVVSHDRFFLDRCVEQLFVFEKDGIRKFPGSYSDYLLVRNYQKEEKENKKPTLNITPKSQRQSRGISYKEQRELELLTQEIENLETQIKNLEDSLNSTPTLTHLDYLRISEELESLNMLYQQKLQRWFDLSEK